MLSTKLRRTLAVGATAGLLLVGCGGGEDVETDVVPGEMGTETTPATTPTS